MSDNIKKVYQSFIKAGFSPNQAKALTAEVGRENAYQSKYIFGHHTDMANSADNLGFFSWQGERKKNLLNKLQQKGLYSNGRISESQESLNTMAEFAKEEMENISSYKKTKEGFLKNPNISQAEAAELLGRNYLRWDMDGKYIKNVGEHKKRRDKFYSQISGEPYTEQQYAGNSQTTPQEQPQAGYVGMLPNGLPDVYGQPYVAEEETKTETAEAPKRTDNANKLGFVADYEELAKQYEQQLQAQQKPILQQEIVEGVQYQPIQQNFQKGGEKNDTEWLKNWYQNRIIPNQDIQNLYEEDKDSYVNRLQTPPTTIKTDIIDNTPQITGRYDGKNILMTPNASDNVYLHELTHYSDDFPSAMRTAHGEIVRQNAAPKEYTQGIYNEKYDYFTDPDEVHARIQVLRKKAGIKPDQNVTPEVLDNFLKGYKGEDENINDLLNIADPPHLLEMINFMAVNEPKNKKVWTAQLGGIKIDPQGYWNPDNEGKPVIIPSPHIDMQNVSFPVLGTSLETGEQRLMTTNNKYFFANTKNVLEEPLKNYEKK